MTLTLLATPGAANANAYCDRATADAYFEGRPFAEAWTSITDAAVKERALVAATTRLDQEEYVGGKRSSGQALRWPRYGVCDEEGAPVANDAIPTFVVRACCELALYLVQSGTDPLGFSGLEGFESIQLPGLTITPQAGGGVAARGALPPPVLRFLNRYLRTPAGQTRLRRWTD